MSLRTVYLQSIYNGLIELGFTPPFSDLDPLLEKSGPWLRLLEKTDSWPEGQEACHRFPSEVTAIALPPPSAPKERWRWLAVGCKDGSVCVVDLLTGTPIPCPGTQMPLKRMGHEEQEFGISELTFSPDGSWLAYDMFFIHGEWPGTEETHGFILLWNVTTGKSKHIDLAESQATSLAFSPNGQWLASQGKGGAIWLRNLATGEEKKAVMGGHSPLAFSPDSQWLASQGVGYSIQLWNVTTGEKKHFGQHEIGVHLLAFSPDGQWLAGSIYGSVYLWNVATGEKKHFGQHEIGVHSLAFSPDGQWLACGCWDDFVRFWKVVSKEVAACFLVNGRLNTLLWVPDGRNVTAADDGGGTGSPHVYKLRLEGI